MLCGGRSAHIRRGDPGGADLFDGLHQPRRRVRLTHDLLTTIPNPARVIGRSDVLGSLEVGRPAEVSVFRVVDGPTRFNDGEEEVTGDRRIVPVGCVRNGHWIPTPELPTYDSEGKTWVRSANEDEDW